MTPDELILLENRKAGFQDFYKALILTLVEFVGAMGIQPAHEVLKNAVNFAPYLDRALQNMVVANEKERAWLLFRVGQFIGEYFAQKYSGCWYVNEIASSRYFGRYVVGQFASLKSMAPMLDPFQVAQAYVDAPLPRHMEALLKEVDEALAQTANALRPQ